MRVGNFINNQYKSNLNYLNLRREFDKRTRLLLHYERIIKELKEFLKNMKTMDEYYHRYAERMEEIEDIFDMDLPDEKYKYNIDLDPAIRQDLLSWKPYSTDFRLKSPQVLLRKRTLVDAGVDDDRENNGKQPRNDMDNWEHRALPPPTPLAAAPDGAAMIYGSTVRAAISDCATYEDEEASAPLDCSATPSAPLDCSATPSAPLDCSAVPEEAGDEVVPEDAGDEAGDNRSVCLTAPDVGDEDASSAKEGNEAATLISSTSDATTELESLSCGNVKTTAPQQSWDTPAKVMTLSELTADAMLRNDRCEKATVNEDDAGTDADYLETCSFFRLDKLIDNIYSRGEHSMDSPSTSSLITVTTYVRDSLRFFDWTSDDYYYTSLELGEVCVMSYNTKKVFIENRRHRRFSFRHTVLKCLQRSSISAFECLVCAKLDKRVGKYITILYNHLGPELQTLLRVLQKQDFHVFSEMKPANDCVLTDVRRESIPKGIIFRRALSTEFIIFRKTCSRIFGVYGETVENDKFYYKVCCRNKGEYVDCGLARVQDRDKKITGGRKSPIIEDTAKNHVFGSIRVTFKDFVNGNLQDGVVSPENVIVRDTSKICELSDFYLKVLPNMRII